MLLFKTTQIPFVKLLKQSQLSNRAQHPDNADLQYFSGDDSPRSNKITTVNTECPESDYDTEQDVPLSVKHHQRRLMAAFRRKHSKRSSRPKTGDRVTRPTSTSFRPVSDLSSIRNSARPLSSSRVPTDVFHQKNKSFTYLDKGAESARPYDISMANIEDNRSYLWKVIQNAYDPVYSSTFGNFTHYNSFKYLKSQIEQTGETLPTSPDTMNSPRPPSSSRLSHNLLNKHRAQRMRGSILNNETVRGLHRISQHNESQSSAAVPAYPPKRQDNLITFRRKEKEPQVKTLNEIKEIYREQKKTYYKRRPLLESAVSRYYSSLPKQTRHVVIKRNISSIQRSIDPVQISITDNTASRLSGLASGHGEFSGLRSDSRASNRTLNFDKSVSDIINKSFTVGYGPTRGRGISNVALVQGFKIK